MLAIVWILLAAVATQHVLSSLYNRMQWSKLEGAIRNCLADRDMDRLAAWCRHYNLSAAASVIAAIAAQAKVGHPTALTKLERFKQAGRSATRTELRKWMGGLNSLDSSVCVSLSLLAAWVVADLARSLQNLSQTEGAAGVALSWEFHEDFPLLWCGLLLLVSHLVFRRIILSRIKKLELRINRLSMDFIVGLLSTANKRPAPKYRPGMWMAPGETTRNRCVSAPAVS
jgi:hypothetical protein